MSIADPTGVVKETKRETHNDRVDVGATVEAGLAKSGSVRSTYYVAMAAAAAVYATKNGEVIAIIDA